MTLQELYDMCDVELGPLFVQKNGIGDAWMDVSEETAREIAALLLLLPAPIVRYSHWEFPNDEIWQARPDTMGTKLIWIDDCPAIQPFVIRDHIRRAGVL